MRNYQLSKTNNKIASQKFLFSWNVATYGDFWDHRALYI